MEVALSYELATPEEKPVTNPVGIGDKRLTTSDGKTVEKREIDRKKIIRLQRSVSRKVLKKQGNKLVLKVKGLPRIEVKPSQGKP